MKYLHNIEKSAFHKGEYVGYAANTVWRITRTSCSDGNWVAHARDDYNKRVAAFRLDQLSEKLGAL